FDRYILALDIAGFGQALTEGGSHRRVRPGRRTAQTSNHRQRRPPSTCREPPRCRPAKKGDELASFHVDFALALIASSASACHPAWLSFIRATSVIWPSATMRSACAGPARTSSDQQLGRKSIREHQRLGAAVRRGGEQLKGAATVGLRAVAAAVGLGHGVAAVVNRGRQDTTRPEPARWGARAGGGQKPQRRSPGVWRGQQRRGDKCWSSQLKS